MALSFFGALPNTGARLQLGSKGPAVSPAPAGTSPAAPSLVGHPVVEGLSYPPRPNPTNYGTFQPTRNLTTSGNVVSYTAAPTGGAPGGQNGIPLSGGVSLGGFQITGGRLLGAALIIGAIYLLTK